jgi:hypothetical protein
MKILSMKKLILIAIVLPIIFSCSKKEGCNYSEATNYDEMVVVDDGSCRFSKLTFYADTTHINGVYITRIDINIDGVVVGSFDGMELNMTGDCSGGDNTYVYDLDNGTINWNSAIYLTGGTILTSSGAAVTDPNIPCIEINALP